MNNINNKNMKVPEGWKVELLDKICKLSYGKNLPTEKFIDDGKYPVYGANGLIGFYVDYTHKDEVILVSCRGEYSGVINLSQPFSFITNNSIPLEIKNNDEIFTRFLFYRIKIIPKQTFVSGSAQPQVVINDLKRLIITIPISFVEQQKIAEILETVDRAIEKTDKIIEKYKRIKQGLMQDLLTKGIDENGKIRSEKTHKFKNSPLGRIPEEWEVGNIKDLAELNPKTKIDPKKLYPFVEMDATPIMGKKYRYINFRKGREGGTKFKRGDILIARITPCAENGKSLLVPLDIQVGIGSTEFIVFRAKENIDNIFLFYLLISDHVRTVAIGLMEGTSGRQRIPNYVFEEVIKVAVPKFKFEQKRIAEILSQIDNTIEKEEAYKQKLERIKKGLMEDLLTGRVRVNKLIKEKEVGYE